MLSISNQPLIAPPYQVPTKTWEAYFFGESQVNP